MRLNLNYFQSVRDKSSRVQGLTIDTQEIPQLFPNKLPKQLKQYDNWKLLGTKRSPEIPSKNQLKAEYNLRLN